MTWVNRIVGYSEEPPDQLLANPKNYRTHPGTQAAALRGVLAEVGVVQNVLANKTTGFLIDGHLRVMEALKAGQPTIPVTWVELSEAEEAVVLATLDPLSALAGTDAAQLDALLRDVSTGDAAVQQMLDDLATEAGIVPGAGVVEDEPVSVDESAPTRCQPGDVWRVGRHAVACLDSTDRANVERVVAGRKVGMVWADPPYAINAVDEKTGQTGALGRPGEGYSFGGVRNDGKSKPIKPKVYVPVIGDSSIETATSSASLYVEEYPTAIHFWWGANNYAHILPPSTCWIVWDKENNGAFADAELAWSNDKSAVRIFKHQWSGMIKASEHGQARVHPTQKPIALCAWAFDKYGKADDLIVDPFLGSGPSLKAAEQSGRTVVGFELSPHYVDHVLEWAEAHGLMCERVDTTEVDDGT